MIQKLKTKIYEMIPKDLKPILRCWNYNLFKNNKFKLRYKDGYYEVHYLNEVFKYNKCPYEIFKVVIEGYMRDYKPEKVDTVLDAGSYYGVFSIFISKFVNKVYAFEPDPDSVKLLKENIKINNITNIIIIEKGLWDKKDILNFNQDGGRSEIIELGISKVDVIKLDDEYENYNMDRLDFVKMDIEGAEIQTVVGMKDVINKFKPEFAIASYHIVNNQMTYIFLEEYFRKLYYNSVYTDYPKHLTTYLRK